MATADASGAVRAPGTGSVRPYVAFGAAGAPPAALVAAGVVLLAVGLPAPGAVLLALGLLVVAAAAVAGAPGRLLAHLPVRPVDAVGEARLVNLVEALCVADGLPVPELRVLEDPAPNAVVLGRRPGDAVLVVTSGLLGLLDRMELEAIVAHELSHAKRRDLGPAAAACRALGPLAPLWPATGRVLLRVAGATREALADQAAVRVTRYPPALASALEKLAAAGTTRPSGLSPALARLTGPLWCAPLDEARSERPLAGVLDLQERAALLREL